MYVFHLNVRKDSSSLALLEDVREIASRQWQESRDMGRQLFEAIDAILKEKGIEPTDIQDFQVETSVSDTFTSVKIAQTVAETYRFAVGK